MTSKTWYLGATRHSHAAALASLLFVGGCGDDAATKDDPSDDLNADDFDYFMQDVALASDLVVPAGKTVRVGPGVTFTAAKDVKIQVDGTLIVEGTESDPTRFFGQGKAKSWHGIVIEKGGKLQLDHAEIGGASYGLLALPGSDFTVSYAEIGTSFKAAVVQSDGSFDHTLFVATTPDGISIADQVSIDDPNGTLTIMDASPTITNCQFDGSSGYTDMVRIGGESSPTFDHVYLHSAHCGFHTFGSVNGSPRIKNAILEELAYGVMAYTTKPIIEDSIFRMNATDIGICKDATDKNTPVLKNNHYDDGVPRLDTGCRNIGTSDASPASVPNAEAGPSGL